jgi:hypothetical protein
MKPNLQCLTIVSPASTKDNGGLSRSDFHAFHVLRSPSGFRPAGEFAMKFGTDEIVEQIQARSEGADCAVLLNTLKRTKLPFLNHTRPPGAV